jgi:hypothetical protein
MYSDEIKRYLIKLNEEESFLNIKEAQRLDTLFGYRYLLDDDFTNNVYVTMDHMHLFACFWRIFQYYGFHILSDSLLYQSVKDKEKLKNIPEPDYNPFVFFPQ